MSDGQAGERPPLPGAPFVLPHPRHRRIGYVIVALSLAIFGNFGNSLISTNLSEVAGGYGVSVATATWLVAVYVGMGTCSNLFMIIGREQFGYDRMLIAALVAYALTAAVELMVPSFGLALVGRALNGLATSTGVAVGIYYLLQVLPKAKRVVAIVLIIGCVQIATPLARFVPVDVLTADNNHGLRLVIFALVLGELALVLSWPLPPAYRVNMLQWSDALTSLLLVPPCVLIAGVLTLGRTRWWIDTPWLGWMLVAAIPLVTAAIIVELFRTRPLLVLSWFTRGDIIRFAIVALTERTIAAQQSTAVMGLGSLGGLDNDQFHGLFAIVALAMIAGIVVSIMTLSKEAIPVQMISALVLIGLGSWLDSGSNGLTRPDNLLFSQSLIGFGLTLFAGPALLYSVGQVLKTGPEIYVSMIVIFSATQYLGSAIGSAILGSAQYVFEQIALVALSGHVRAPFASDDLAGLNAGTQAQAAVIGYLDTFGLVGIVALVAAAVLTAHILVRRFLLPQQEPQR